MADNGNAFPNDNPASIGHNSGPLLAELRDKINYHHDRAVKGAVSVAEDVIQEGRALIRAKKIVGHGHWGTWLSENCPKSWSTGVTRMRLARAIDGGNIELAELANFGLDWALKSLRTRKNIDPIAHKKHKLQQNLTALLGKPRTQYQHNRLIEELDDLKDEEVTAEEIVQIGILGAVNQPAPPEWGQAWRISWTGVTQNGRRAIYIWQADRDLPRNEEPRFRWLSVDYGEVWEADRCHCDVSSEEGSRWEQVHENLSNWCNTASSVVEVKVLAYDPIRTTLLEEFWGFIDVTKTSRSSETL